MKKTVSRIMALFAALALLFTAAPAAFADDIARQIAAAVEAADTLSTYAVILSDGTLVDLGEFAAYGPAEYLEFYRSLGKIKKIEHLMGKKPAVLTESGDLYVGDQLIAQNIADMIYPANDASGDALYLDNSGAFAEFRYSSEEIKIWPRPNAAYAKFARLDVEAMEEIHFEGAAGKLICDDKIFWVLSENGVPYCDGETSGELMRDGVTLSEYMDQAESVMEKYLTLELHTWSDLAVFAFTSEYEQQLGVNYYSYAGVKGDGTVVACGKLADEVLSWGKLKYIDGKMGDMLGVTADGKIKLAGPHIELWVLEEVDKWQNIVCARIIPCKSWSYDIGIIAIDSDGVIYKMFSESDTTYDGRTSWEIGTVTYSPENGYQGVLESRDNLRELGLII